MKNLIQIFCTIFDTTIEKNGFTFSISQNKFIEGRGFAVANIKNSERIFENFENIDKIKFLCILKNFYIENIVNFLDNKNLCLGGWVDNGRLYLDVSTVLYSKKEALRIASANGELAIFDLSTFETIYLKKTS